MKLITFFTLLNALVASGAPGVERRDEGTTTITTTFTRTITIYVTAKVDPTTVVATETREPTTVWEEGTTRLEESQLPSLPPVQAPVTEPSNVQPPAAQPTNNDSPVDQSPVVQPPTTQPPTGMPPVVQPPNDESPSEQPPAAESPVVQPPTEQAPVEQPSTEQPVVISPPNEGSPVEQPSSEQPPVVQPPNDETPVVQQPAPQPQAGQGVIVLPINVAPTPVFGTWTQPLIVAPSTVQLSNFEPTSVQTSNNEASAVQPPNVETSVVLTSNAESPEIQTSTNVASSAAQTPGAEPTSVGTPNPESSVAQPSSAESTGVDSVSSVAQSSNVQSSTMQTLTSQSSAVQSDLASSAAPVVSSEDAGNFTMATQTATFTQVASSVVETSTVTAEVSVTTVSKTSGAVQILPTPSTLTPSSIGSIETSLNVTGVPTSAPVISTIISEPSTTIETSAISSVASTVVTDAASANIFVPIATGAPHGSIPRRDDHPVPRQGINQKSPLSTNKFYGNFFLGNQDMPTWTHPFSVFWAKGRGNAWGMAVSHVDAEQRSFGPDPNSNPTQYFVNPYGIQSIVLSASELGESTVLTLDKLTAFSAHINLLPAAGSVPAITFPVVQGMGFVTGIYNGGTPVINSGVLFRSLTKTDEQPKAGVTKYRIVLEDGKVWLLYASSADGLELDLKVVNNGLIQATSNFNGFIQVAKIVGSGEEHFDATCGTYAEGVELSGSVNGDSGSYTLAFKKAGLFKSALLMFALPHHVQSFSGQTASGLTDLQLITTTKGTATAVIADSWTMVEELPVSMGFAPWSPETGSVDNLSQEAIDAIKDIAASEVSQDMDRQTNSDSMYFGGKALAKFAGVVYTLSNLLDEKALGQAGLAQLKDAFGRFVVNKQQYPLTYESAWGGVVSTASYINGDSIADFGNTYYNDHHFHYGYHIYAAAVIAHLDPTVLEDDDFTSYVNTLLRDISNPSSEDPYFPVQRAFDYYHGHSWAKGLFASADGKDQESTSEDMMHAYAIKSWGLATGDANIIARGNLQLAVTARSIKNYYLYESDNKIQPAQIIGNKVSGIMFENKIDHITYFGSNIEYIQGIHMLPLLPCTALARTKNLVQEEWDTYFSNGRADAISSGWKGVLYANLIRIEPKTSWDFFVGKDSWSPDWIDGGASRTWYLAFAAAMRDGQQAASASSMSINSLNQSSVETYKRSEVPPKRSFWSRVHKSHRAVHERV